MDESNLVQRALEKDHQAFEMLLKACEKKAYGVCFKIVKDPHRAQELVQEARIKAFEKLEQFEHKSSFSSWFCAICKNEALSFLRKNKETQLTFDPKQLFDIQEDFFDQLIEKLSFKHKQIITLYYQQGLTQKQIATELNLAYGTVRSRLHYAKGYLKKNQKKKF